jgi:transcriptional regulator with XRE-family HTH domain
MLIRLREWRERRRLSVRELASLAGVQFSTVHRIEKGTLSPTLAMLETLADALDITVRDLIPVQPRPRRKPQ